jgi:hypothetical protein
MIKKSLELPDMNALSLPNDDGVLSLIREAERRQTSAWVCEQLAKQIRSFESQLDNEHEIGARLASFGGSVLVHIEAIRSIAPNIIVFEGTSENDEPLTLVQHMTQMSVLFVAVKKKGPEPVRLGFIDFSVSSAD